MTSDPPSIRHGDASDRRDTVPRYGEKFVYDSVALHLVPAKTFEVNCRADRDLLTLCLGRSVGVRAHNSDRLSDYQTFPGQFSFVPKGSDVYARSHQNEGEMVSLVLDENLRQTMIEECPSPTRPSFSRSYSGLDNPDSLPLAQIARRLAHAPRRSSRIVIESLAVMALNMVVNEISGRQMRKENKKRLTREDVTKILDLIEARLHKDIGLTELADELRISSFKFSQIFKSTIGISPHQYILERRLHRAQSLLREKNSSLADIAYASGFSSQAHMTDVFRRRLGITPGKLRAQLLA